ncbi:MAG: phospholipid carrier-dependent glycosyltransferase [Gallionella sp.]|nr:phospholipid carrier-dependent glycosyltransferase [Gallionella sp.]
MSNPTRLLLWYVCATLLAVCTYFYGLDSQFIPKNGDEYPYEHITRLTAASGEWLPLQSQLDNMRNTKPPLLFWQGIASTHGGQNWTLWDLRYPSVIYTLLTAGLLFLLGWKLTAKIETGFIAALTFLAFFTTYRFGRPFLTNAPEVFWLFLPFFALLYWRQAFQSRFIIPALLGISIGIAFLYKSFALGLPVTLGLCGWHLHQRQYRVLAFIKQDALKVCITISVAVGMFALWFALDPDPQAVWKEFVVGENVGKFDPHGPSYLAKLLWGGSSVWSFTAAFLTNAGLLTFVVIALFVVAFQNRRQMSNEHKLLWLWIAALFFSFCLPSQRSGRYLLAAMPAVALLCALDWQHISRKVFVATLVLCGALLLGLALLAVRLQSGIGDAHLFPSSFWLLLTGSGMLLLVAIVLPGFTRPAVNVVALLVLLSFAAFLRPLDNRLANYSGDAQRYAQDKTVAVPCNFRAHDEGHRFLLPGAHIVGYQESQNLSVTQLSERYDLFAVQLPLQSSVADSACAECKIIGQRLDIRGRQSDEELRDMFFHGRFFEHLFIREVLMASSVTPKVVVSHTLAEVCR